MSWYQKGKTNLDFTEARDSEWQWHQLGYMQVCTSLQTDNHASTSTLSFLQAGCPSCRPTNSVKALKACSDHYLRSLLSLKLSSGWTLAPGLKGRSHVRCALLRYACKTQEAFLPAQHSNAQRMCERPISFGF